MDRIYGRKDGEPCSHPGCLHHVTHPCEGCGRIAGRRIAHAEEKPDAYNMVTGHKYLSGLLNCSSERNCNNDQRCGVDAIFFATKEDASDERP